MSVYGMRMPWSLHFTLGFHGLPVAVSLVPVVCPLHSADSCMTCTRCGGHAVGDNMHMSSNALLYSH